MKFLTLPHPIRKQAERERESKGRCGERDREGEKEKVRLGGLLQSDTDAQTSNK